MDFQELNNLIPYAKGGKEKVLEMNPYDGITLAMPGRHWKETIPIGGDFVVMVTDYNNVNWKKHQFKHDDIFDDIEIKLKADRLCTLKLVRYYGAVVMNSDPLNFDGSLEDLRTAGVNPYYFLRAVQCLAVAEHRRYERFESKFGGRYLPFRFAAGIVEERWTAADCKTLQKSGRPGVESLEKQNGTPHLTKDLIAACLNKS